MVKYTEEQIKYFIEHACPAEIIGADRERIIQVMKGMNYKAPDPRSLRITREYPTVARDEIDDEMTSWALLDAMTGKIKCDKCGYKTWMQTSLNLFPKCCNGCKRKTKDRRFRY